MIDPTQYGDLSERLMEAPDRGLTIMGYWEDELPWHWPMEYTYGQERRISPRGKWGTTYIFPSAMRVEFVFLVTTKVSVRGTNGMRAVQAPLWRRLLWAVIVGPYYNSSWAGRRA